MSKVTYFILFNEIEFLSELENPNSLIFVIDEAGFGTNPLRHYAYSRIGTPAILRPKKIKMYKNLTCTATISSNGIEML